MNLPLKLRHGDNLAALYVKFNAVIDYLTRTRLVAGSGIRVSQLPAGQTIESTATAAGGSAAAPAGGMFQVRKNPDGTVTVTAGIALISPGYGPAEVAGTTLQGSPGYLMLNATRADRALFYSVESTIAAGAIPGERMTWPIACLGPTFAQLWTGGMIDFSVRYYVV